jgi:hypothetical protein
MFSTILKIHEWNGILPILMRKATVRNGELSVLKLKRRFILFELKFEVNKTTKIVIVEIKLIIK